jgi:hypothetical protein
LIANGYLKQDELWSVLRAHAEWLIGRIMMIEDGNSEWEEDFPERLRAEPAVFGGSTGAEVFVETARRVIQPDAAYKALGGRRALFERGPHAELLSECALTSSEVELVRRAPELSLGDLTGGDAPADLPAVLLALTQLGILASGGGRAGNTSMPPPPAADALDDQALRERIQTRMKIVQEGDYFAVLGVSRNATEYEIKRAYEGLKAEFDHRHGLSPRNADLKGDLDTILEVVDEAYEVLGDRVRRERYRRAIEAIPG